MKLIKEYIIKEILVLLAAAIVIEGFIIYLLNKRAKIIYEDTYNETNKKIENKTLEAAIKIEELAKNYLSKYLTDLKLIVTHSFLFNINKNTTNNNKLDNENKKIYTATLEDLKKEEDLNKYLNNEQFSYVNKYEEEFKNIKDTNIILNSLLDNEKHPELNTIGYYNQDNQERILEEEINIKNMISIFKTIFIKRYLVKGRNLDLIHLFILNKKKMFIYPPNAYNLTHSYSFFYFNGANCDNSGENNKFPLCYYN